jgi:hypothetical protein
MPDINGEVVFIQLVDVGRYINLKGVIPVFPEFSDTKFMKTKDTPEFIYIPTPLRLKISHILKDKEIPLKRLRLQIKLYEDGVIALIARLNFANLPLEKLHTIRKIKFPFSNFKFSVDEWMNFHFKRIYEKIESFIDKSTYIFNPPEEEKYTCFCITNEMGDPSKFLEQHKDYLAVLLMEENPGLELHPKQINTTLANPFSFYSNDIIIFDFHRCLIFDPNNDYEDVLLILELANYELLELRNLDRLLDIKLDVAEDDLRKIFLVRRKLWRKLNKKLGELYRLKFDINFIFENIENVSKIIGDYYLAQIYKHLSNMFQLDKWSESIRNRLNILDDIYTTAKASANERIILIVEILLGVLFSLEFIIAIINFFK